MEKLIRAFHAKDIEIAGRYLAKTPFWSGYWVRKRIDDAVAANASAAKGVLLDAGCGTRRYQLLFSDKVTRQIGIDLPFGLTPRENKADVHADVVNIPLADCSVDTVVCTEVLVNLEDPEMAIAEFARILRPAGVLIATAPFVYPVHDRTDYFRFTSDGIRVMAERHGFAVEQTVPLSGTAVTMAANLNLYWFDFCFMWKPWLYPIGVALRPVLLLVCFIVNVVGRFLELVLPDERLPLGHLVVARKL